MNKKSSAIIQSGPMHCPVDHSGIRWNISIFGLNGNPDTCEKIIPLARSYVLLVSRTVLKGPLVWHRGTNIMDKVFRPPTGAK